MSTHTDLIQMIQDGARHQSLTPRFEPAAIDPVMQAEMEQLREALEECEDYFDRHADADLVGDPPKLRGNEAMSLLTTVRKALGKET